MIKLLISRRLFLMVFGLFFLTTIYAVNNPTNDITQNVSWQAIGPVGSGNTINNLVGVPGQPNTLLTSVTYGGIYRSDNSGKNWRAINNGLFAKVESVVAVNNSFFLAGTGNGLYQTNNGGVNWQQIANWAQGQNDVVNIAVVNSKEFLAVVGYAHDQNFQLLQTTDAGAHWKTINLKGANPFQIIAFNTPANFPTFLVATSDGLLKSTDNGNSWRTLLSANITGITFVDNNTIFAFNSVQNGSVYKTTDGGQHWQTIYQASNHDVINAVAVVNPHTYLVALTIGGVIETTNGGETWNPINNGLPFDKMSLFGDCYNVQDIYILSANNYLLGSAYGIYNTIDAGKNWIANNDGISNTAITAISIVNPKIMVAASSPYQPSMQIPFPTVRPQIYSTINGGATWKNITGDLPIDPVGSSIPLDFIISLLELDPNNIWVSTQQLGLYHTMDGGVHWYSPIAHTQIRGISAIDSQNLLAFGTNIYKSVNGGATWMQLNVNANGFNGMMIIDKNIYVAYTQNQLYKTTDGGNTWVQIGKNVNFRTIWSLALYDKNNTNSYLMATSGGLYESPDGGVTWYPVEGSPPPALLSIAPLNSYTVLGGTYLSGVYISHDGGVNWNPYNQNLNSYRVNLLQFYGNTLYAGTNGGVNQVWVDPTNTH